MLYENARETASEACEMCGIAGEIRLDGQNARAETVQKMLNQLESRGPDGTGIVSFNQFAFGQRRLKIIDLSDRAQQPMVDSHLGLGIVYNGAIYNYKDLKNELESKGYRFFSTGDTEVLLKAYHAWGIDFVKRLAGMFAFAIWERDSGRVIFGRDRLGIKPLYYSESARSFAFASSLPALLSREELDRSIDPAALHYYMSLHSIVPAPRTILKGVRKVEPGTVTVMNPDGNRSVHRYWDLRPGSQDPVESDYSFEEWKAIVLDRLRAAVSKRLVADVPVGVLLSGGVDSSLIAGLIAENSSVELKTFSIGFESTDEEKGDEFQYSDLIAKKFGTKHQKILIETGRVLDAIPGCVKNMAEPMVSYDVVAFYLLSQEVSRYVKVVQSGQGADEVFGGYHWYPPFLNESHGWEKYSELFKDRSHEEFGQAVQGDWVSKDFTQEYLRDYFERNTDARVVDRVLALDTSVMLVEDPVKRVDNMTMAWGLEARVPFLDHEVVETAVEIPAEFKIGPDGKYILKEAARTILPNEVIDRPKGYFPVPALKYLRGKYLDFVKDVLTDPRARHRGIFNPTYIEKVSGAPEKHITPLRGSKLWQIAVLEMWLQNHEI